MDQRKLSRVWGLYRRHRSGRLRDLLVTHYLALVEAVAANVKGGLPRSVEVGDLVAMGVFGLIDAIESYDPAKASFETHARTRIWGAIMDGLRDADWASRTMRGRARRLEQTAGRLAGELGRRPTPEEIAGRMGVAANEYLRHERAVASLRGCSLSGDRREEPGGRLREELIDTGHGADPVREAQRATIKELVTKGLSREERLIVLLYYFEGLTLAEIGQVLGVCESRVSQKRKEILDTLKGRLAERQLR